LFATYWEQKQYGRIENLIRHHNKKEMFTYPKHNQKYLLWEW
jgi:hypothetical protein